MSREAGEEEIAIRKVEEKEEAEYWLDWSMWLQMQEMRKGRKWCAADVHPQAPQQNNLNYKHGSNS